MMTSKISHNKIGAVYLSQKFFGEDKSKIIPPLIQPRPAGNDDDQQVNDNHDDQKVNDGEYKVAHES